MQTRSRVIWIVVIAIVFIGVFFFGWWVKPVEYVENNSAVDSIRYVYFWDSIKHSFIEKEYADSVRTLRVIIKKQDKELAARKPIVKAGQKKIRKLPLTEAVKYFSDFTRDSAYVAVIREDTIVVSTLKSITEANVTNYNKLSAEYENRLLLKQNRTLKDIITVQDSLVAEEQRYNVKLSDSYYKSQKVINGLKADSKKDKRRVRNLKIVAGVSIGVAVGGILTAILVK